MQNNVEIIQINISGEDKPGMTSSLTEILARYDAFILDIGQANIHQSLTLGILIQDHVRQVGQHHEGAAVQGIGAGRDDPFHPHLANSSYDDWVGRQGKNRYIITLLGTYGHGAPHRRSDDDVVARARAEHRRHQSA